MSEDEVREASAVLANAIDAAEVGLGMTTIPDNIWEQWGNEDDVVYGNFLIYLTLGRGRTIDKAWRLNQAAIQRDEAKANGLVLSDINLTVSGKASAGWWRNAHRFKWEERAARYDVHVLSQLVPQTVTSIFEVIGEFARVTLDQLRSNTYQPESWAEIKASVETLASYISPDIIQATVAHSRVAELQSAELGDGGDQA